MEGFTMVHNKKITATLAALLCATFVLPVQAKKGFSFQAFFKDQKKLIAAIAATGVVAYVLFALFNQDSGKTKSKGFNTKDLEASLKSGTQQFTQALNGLDDQVTGATQKATDHILNMNDAVNAVKNAGEKAAQKIETSAKKTASSVKDSIRNMANALEGLPRFKTKK
jgi:hypothetical protein